MGTVLKNAGAAAVTLTNRFIGFVPDIETGKPLIYVQAGVGDSWTKPLTLRWINEVRKACGGENFIAGTNNGVSKDFITTIDRKGIRRNRL